MGTVLAALIAVVGMVNRVEPGTVQVASSNGGRIFHVRVPPAVLKATPAWPKGADAPLSPLKAMLRADAKRKQLVQDMPGVFTWEMEKATILPALGGERWYYEITYHAHFQTAISTGHPPALTLIVLMDGTVPEPIVWERHKWFRAMSAGAFDPVRPAAPVSPKKAKDQSGRVDGIDWPSIFQTLKRSASWTLAFWQVVAAPKVEYHVDKLTSCRNGVWAEFTVTNPSDRRVAITPLDMKWPVASMSIIDAEGRRWTVPQFHGSITYGNPTIFTPIEPGKSVRFRSQLSTSGKPLEPWHGPALNQPTEVSYWVMRWTHVYLQPLTPEPEAPRRGTKPPPARRDLPLTAASKRQRVYALGSGKVPVIWLDGDAPENWKSGERLAADGKEGRR